MPIVATVSEAAGVGHVLAGDAVVVDTSACMKSSRVEQVGEYAERV